MSKEQEFARMWYKFLKYAVKEGIELIVTELYRSTVRQQVKYKENKSECDGIYNKSKHQIGRAGDIVIIKQGKPEWNYCSEYEKLGFYWEKLGGTWGHRWYEQGKTKFDDIYHFEN